MTAFSCDGFLCRFKIRADRFRKCLLVGNSFLYYDRYRMVNALYINVVYNKKGMDF